MGRAERDERGMTLLEVAISTGIMLVVMASVAGSIELMSSNVSTMAQTTNAINQEQIAEQTVVRDLHSATSWCTSPTTSQLEFTATLNGTTKVYDFQISGNALTLQTASSCPPGGTLSSATVLLTNVDTSSSTPVSQQSGFFSWPSASSNPSAPTPVTANGTSFYTSLGVILTVDSPSVKAARPTRTTVSDSVVEIWNAEQQCQTAWVDDPVGSDPC